MNRIPLTKAQARDICRDFQFLIGQYFDKAAPGKGCIACIAVAPFEESRQWQFAQYYKEVRDAGRSLQFYTGNDFDVIVLALPLLRKRGIHFQRLSDFLKANPAARNKALASQRADHETSVAGL